MEVAQARPMTIIGTIAVVKTHAAGMDATSIGFLLPKAVSMESRIANG